MVIGAGPHGPGGTTGPWPLIVLTFRCIKRFQVCCVEQICFYRSSFWMNQVGHLLIFLDVPDPPAGNSGLSAAVAS